MKFPLLAVFLAVPLGGCVDFPVECDNDVVQEVPSPNGQWKAVVFQRDCGATTGFSTQISLVAKGSPLPDEGGNIFVADDNRGKAPSGAGGGPQVWVRWLGANQLKITYDHRARTFGKETQYQGVSVSYGTN